MNDVPSRTEDIFILCINFYPFLGLNVAALYILHIVCAIPKTRYVAYCVTQQRKNMDTAHSTVLLEWNGWISTIQHAIIEIVMVCFWSIRFSPLFDNRNALHLWMDWKRFVLELCTMYDVYAFCRLSAETMNCAFDLAFCLYALTTDSPRPMYCMVGADADSGRAKLLFFFSIFVWIFFGDSWT